MCRAWAMRLAEREGAPLGVTPEVALGPSRLARFADVRRRVCMLLHTGGFSYPTIGLAIGRDHTSVIDAVRVREGQLARQYGLPWSPRRRAA